MNRISLTIAFLAISTSGWGQGAGSGFSAYATVGSDYVHRGLSQTNGDAVFQVGADYQHRSGFFAGGWVSNVDFASEATRTAPREIEVDYYVGYNWLNRDWSVAATLARYDYLDTSVEYDYTELSTSIGFRERFFYTLSYTDSLFSHDVSAMGHEFGIEWPLPWETQLAAAVGRFDSDDVEGGQYDHWNVGISKQIWRFGLDLRYYDADYDRVSPLGAALQENWVVSLSYRL